MRIFQTALACSLVVLSIVSFAQIDLSFRPSISGLPVVTAAAIQSDGKVLVAGRFWHLAGRPVPQLIRINSDGSLDETFQPPASLEQVYFNTILVDGVGRILLAGWNMVEYEPVLVRLQSNGAPDPSFSRPIQIKGSIVKVVADGVGGYYVASFTESNRWLMRISASGELDTSFDAGDPPIPFSNGGFDFVVQPDGKVVLVGLFERVSGVRVNRVARLNSNGSIDNSFNIGSGPTGNGFVVVYSVSLQGKNLLLAGKFSQFNGVLVAGLVRLQENGQVDVPFTQSGLVGNLFPEGLNRVVALADGVLLYGFRYRAAAYEFLLVKLTNQGLLDSNFPERVMPRDFNNSELGNLIIETHNSNVFVTGGFRRIGAAKRRGLALLDNRGDPIEKFNPALGGPATITCMKRQSDGKVLLGGLFSTVNGVEVYNLVRLNSNGSLDTVFQKNLGIGFNRTVRTIDFDTNSNILVGGAFDHLNGKPVSCLVRLNREGVIDPSFDPALYASSVGTGVNQVLLFPEGKLFVVGQIRHKTNQSVRNLVRLQANGLVDKVFDLNGDANTEHIQAVISRSNGNLLIAGWHFWPQAGFLKEIDPNGVVLRDIWAENNLASQWRPNAIEVLPTGRILIGGSFINSWSPQDPNPIFQFDEQYRLVDRNSLAVFGGEIIDLVKIGNRMFVLGDYKRLNLIPAQSFSAITMNGIPDPFIQYEIEASSFQRPTAIAVIAGENENTVFVGGSIRSVLGATVDGIAKINLAVPFPPTTLTAIAEDLVPEIRLQWKDNSSVETGFRMFRTDNTEYKQIANLPADQDSYIDNTSLPDRLYSYYVVSVGQGFESAPSNVASVSTRHWLPPKPPSGFFAAHVLTTSEINLTWKDESNNENAFLLERAEGTINFVEWKRLPANTTSFSEPIQFDKKIRYRLRASNAFGDSERLEFTDLPVITEADQSRQSFLQAYPNPTSGRFWIGNEAEIELVVNIYNSTGDRLAQRRSREQTIQFDLSGYSDGLFSLVVFDGRLTRSIKVVKKN
jgi:uncharacterized delta-60 repeat protein